AGTAVRDRQRREWSAALVDDRGGVASLVDVDTDGHALSLPVRGRDRLGLGAGRGWGGGLGNAPYLSLGGSARSGAVDCVRRRLVGAGCRGRPTLSWCSTRSGSATRW